MGQLLIIQGRDEASVRLRLDRALHIFASLCGLEPIDRIAAGRTAAQVFPRLGAPSLRIVRDPGGNAWTAGVGTLFCGGLADEEGLEAAHAALRASPDLSPAVLRGLDGPFVLATGDTSSGDLAIVTDRVGTICAYRATVDDVLMLSTSSLVLAGLTEAAWEPASLAEFLATGTVFEDRSLFRGIEKLPAATVFRFRNGRPLERRRYWSAADFLFDRSSEGTTEALADALSTSIRAISRSFSRPVMDLTGGLDSRALLGAALAAEIPVPTVVNGDPTHPDVTTARSVAGALELSHRHQSLPTDWAGRWWHRARQGLTLCDGEYDLLEYARVLEYHERLAREFDVSLNGSGGEFCRGYWWELLFPRTGRTTRFDATRVARARFAAGAGGAELLRDDLARDLVSHFAGVIERANRELDAYPNTAKMDNAYLELRMQRWQGRIASATDRIWPNVSPFLFARPLEIALSAPPSLRVRDRMAYRLIERLSPRLAALPLAAGHPALPLRFGTLLAHRTRLRRTAGKVFHRLAARLVGRRAPHPGRGDPHLEGLLAEDEVRDLLDPATLRTADLYRPDRLRQLLATPPARLDASRLGRVLTLELLARAIADARAAPAGG